jgi:hypothetical protein
MQRRTVFLAALLIAVVTGASAAPGAPGTPAGPAANNAGSGSNGPAAGAGQGNGAPTSDPGPKDDPGAKGNSSPKDPGPGNPGKGKGPDQAPPAGPDAVVLSPEGSVTIGADQNVARDAVARGEALPLGRIADVLEAQFGLRVIDAKLLGAKSGLIYRLTVISQTGLTQRILVDAKSGKLLRTN